MLEFGRARAEIEKTTPHHCMMDEGIVAQALKSVGATAMLSHVSVDATMRTGAFLSWSPMAKAAVGGTNEALTRPAQLGRVSVEKSAYV